MSGLQAFRKFLSINSVNSVHSVQSLFLGLSVLFHAAARLRAGEFNYISLETVLSDAGVMYVPGLDGSFCPFSCPSRLSKKILRIQSGMALSQGGFGTASSSGNRGGFRGFQDQFLGDLAHLVADLIQRPLVGNRPLHFFGFFGRQAETDRFSADFQPAIPGVSDDPVLSSGFHRFLEGSMQRPLQPRRHSARRRP